MWKNEAEEVRAEIRWNGHTEDDMFYTVYITRGKTDGERFTDFTMNGDYDSSTGKLTAMGSCTQFTKKADGEYSTEEDGETYDAIFSMAEDGKVLYETANGILLDYSEDWVD